MAGQRAALPADKPIPYNRGVRPLGILCKKGRFMTGSRCASFVLVALVISALCLAAAPTTSPAEGYSERPTGTQPLSQSMAEDTLQFFRNKDFENDLVQFSNVTGQPPWNDNDFQEKAKHFSSVRWNLPRGVIVTMFAGKDCMGKCLSVWGSGEISELSKWKMNDDLAGWSWNGVGGASGASQRIQDGRSDRPKYARIPDNVGEDSIELFTSRDAKGGRSPIERVTAVSANTAREMPKGTSSLRWRLAPGVVVVFSEKADNVGPNLAIWGDGQFDTIAHWQMNDKMRYWSWHHLGEK
jgi:hypothetical protein